MSSILKIVTVFLLIVTFSEVGYYIYWQNTHAFSSEKPQNQIFSVIADPTNTITSKTTINPQVLESLKTMKISDNTKVYMTTESIFKVEEVSPEGKSFNGQVYPFVLKINAPDSLNRGSWIYMSKDDILKLKVKKESNPNTDLNPGDIRVGNTIISKQVYNPTKSLDDNDFLISWDIIIK